MPTRPWAVIVRAPDNSSFVFVFAWRCVAEDWIRRNPKEERQHMRLVGPTELAPTKGWKGNEILPGGTWRRSTEWTHPDHPGITILKHGHKLTERLAYTIDGLPGSGRFRTILEAKLHIANRKRAS